MTLNGVFLDRFVNRPELNEVVVDASQSLLLDYMIADGLLEYLGSADGAVIFVTDDSPPDEPLNPEARFRPTRWGAH